MHLQQFGHRVRVLAGRPRALAELGQDARDLLQRRGRRDQPVGLGTGAPRYQYAYDLGETWKAWTGLPFVFVVWVAQRTTNVKEALNVHAQLIESRNWGINNLDILAEQAQQTTGVSLETCHTYLSGLDYGLSYHHLAGLTEFFRRLVQRGRVPNGTLAFLTAA